MKNTIKTNTYLITVTSALLLGWSFAHAAAFEPVHTRRTRDVHITQIAN